MQNQAVLSEHLWTHKSEIWVERPYELPLAVKYIFYDLHCHVYVSEI